MPARRSSPTKASRTKPTRGGARRAKAGRHAWAELPQSELLEVRLSELGVRIEDGALQQRVDRLYAELERRGMRFRPHVWLSTDWFSPDGVPGFAIPFFLAHPRLARLEHTMMYEIEGGASDWCMRLLRHECAHALDNAYRLHRRKSWRETFGKFSEPYRMSYVPNPLSRKYVQNLGFWYAQSHPAEDFAESFAVWLQPGSRWRTAYKGWPAKRKLDYIDELMAEIGGERQKVVDRSRPDSLPRLRMTLGEYYRKKRAFYEVDGSDPESDRHLDQIFSSDRRYRRNRTAAQFLRQHRTTLRHMVAAQTGAYRYVVDQAVRVLETRCKQRQLRMTRSTQATLVEVGIVLTILTMGFVRGTQRPFMR
jgi:hypothetical protein